MLKSGVSANVAGPPSGFGVTSTNGIVNLSSTVWKELERGILQRNRAISAFLTDVITCGKLPRFLNAHHAAAGLCKSLPSSLLCIVPDSGVWSRLSSVDVFVNSSGQPMVMDQEFSCPTGMEKLAGLEQQAWHHSNFRDWMRQILWAGRDGTAGDVFDNTGPTTAVLDSGTFRSTQRESGFLSRLLAAPLIGNRDMRIEDNGVWGDWNGKMRRIDFLIRRLNDDLLDPNCFRPDSLVGVPGLVRAVRQGVVRLSSLPGTGLLRNRMIARLVPEMIGYYLNERPILPTAQTFLCANPDERNLVLGNLNEFVVRTVDVMHPARPFTGINATAAQRADITARLLRDPQGYVARPILASDRRDLTTCESGKSASGFTMRMFAGGDAEVGILPLGLGCGHQADGGIGESVMCDSELFMVR